MVGVMKQRVFPCLILLAQFGFQKRVDEPDLHLPSFQYSSCYSFTENLCTLTLLLTEADN